jgi:hypothetical protein
MYLLIVMQLLWLVALKFRPPKHLMRVQILILRA